MNLILLIIIYGVLGVIFITQFAELTDNFQESYKILLELYMKNPSTAIITNGSLSPTP